MVKVSKLVVSLLSIVSPLLNNCFVKSKRLCQRIPDRFVACISFFWIQNRYREMGVIRFLFHIHIACNLHRVAHDNGKWWRLAVATGMLSREIDLQRIHNWRNIARLQDMSCLSTIQWISFLIMSKIICSFQNSALLVLINQLYADSVRCSTKQVFAQSSKNCKNFLTTAKPLKNIFEWTQF